MCLCVRERKRERERERESKIVDVVHVVILKLLLCLLCSIQLWSLIFLTYAIKWQIQPAWGGREKRERKKIEKVILLVALRCRVFLAASKVFSTQLLIGENRKKNSAQPKIPNQKNPIFKMKKVFFRRPDFFRDCREAKFVFQLRFQTSLLRLVDDFKESSVLSEAADIGFQRAMSQRYKNLETQKGEP